MKNDLTVLNQFEEVAHYELLEVDGGLVLTKVTLVKAGVKIHKWVTNNELITVAGGGMIAGLAGWVATRIWR